MRRRSDLSYEGIEWAVGGPPVTRSCSKSLTCSLGFALAIALAVTGIARTAQAVDCNTLPSPLYGLGGSAQKLLIARVAARLATVNPPQTIIYQAPGACHGINALINNTKITGQASYWNAAGTEQQCTLPVTGQDLDYANMGTAAPFCPGVTSLPTDIGDFSGAVTTWDFLVPTASSQQSISREAAYFVFGLGMSGQVAPWTDEAQLIRRDSNSAAQQAIAIALGLSAERFLGVDAKSNAGTISLLAMSSKPEAAIGFASGETADANRDKGVRILAYQHTGQTCGYWPDSTVSSFDKRNVRNGQYFLWSATHFFARIDNTGRIANPAVAKFVGYFTREVAPPPELPILDLEIQNGNVPKCAMNVWRNTDFGPLMSFQPNEPCGCYFEKLATGTSTCTPCQQTTDGGSDCPASAPVCRRNFCEVR